MQTIRSSRGISSISNIICLLIEHMQGFWSCLLEVILMSKQKVDILANDEANILNQTSCMHLT